MTSPVAVITGANGGLGLRTAIELARRGMRVVMACRSLDKAGKAQGELLAEVPGAEAIVLRLDVSEPESIREFGDALAAEVGPIDLLVNNAGVVLLPLARNSRGHELHLATNHLGPFALTGTLLPRFREGADARVVNVGSLSHRFAKLDLDDPGWERTRYGAWKAYARSKLALQTFTVELDRRLRRAGSRVIAVGAHPGFANTNAGRGDSVLIPDSPMVERIVDVLAAPFVPTAEAAARPIVHAATDPDVRGGDYFGPAGFLGIGGRPGHARMSRTAHDAQLARRLWDASEAWTGVRFLSEA